MRVKYRSLKGRAEGKFCFFLIFFYFSLLFFLRLNKIGGVNEQMVFGHLFSLLLQLFKSPRNVATSLEPPTPIKLNGRTLKSYDPGWLLAPGGAIFFFSVFFFLYYFFRAREPLARTPGFKVFRYDAAVSLPQPVLRQSNFILLVTGFFSVLADQASCGVIC